MIYQRLLVVSLTLFTLAQTGRGAERERVEDLIRQFGSEVFSQRERAMVELEALGLTALEPLRQATKSSDAETARRAGELVRRFEEKLQIEQAQTPKQLRLEWVDMPVLEAVAELTRRSGYALKVGGDTTPLAARKVTLDTGTVTFWEALDRLGAAGGIALPPSPPPPTPDPNAATIAAMRIVRGPRLRNMRVDPITPSAAQEHIELIPGTPARQVSYAGACRVELRVAKSATGLYQLTLDAAAEPRLLSFMLVGGTVVDRAVSSAGQPLTLVEEIGPTRAVRQVALKLTGAPDRIRTLEGTLAARVTIPNELIATIDVATLLRDGNVTVASKSGGNFHVQSFEKQGNGDYRIQALLENMGPNPFAQQIMINGNLVFQGNVAVVGAAWGGVAPLPGLPDLLDGEGRKYQVVETNQSTRLAGNQFTRQLTIVYRPQAGQGEPSRVAYYGMRMFTMPVPFSFHDVNLE
jgi:hypothetical protein